MSQSSTASSELFPPADEILAEQPRRAVSPWRADLEACKPEVLVSHVTLKQLERRVEVLQSTIDNHIKTCVCKRLDRSPSPSPEAPDDDCRPYIIVQTFSTTSPAYWYIPYHLHDRYLENLLEDHDNGHLTIKRRDALFLHLQLCGLKGHTRMPKGVKGPHSIYYIHCSVNDK